GGEVRPIGGEAESLSASPAETGNIELAIGSGEFEAVVGGGVEVGGDLVGIEFADGFHDGIGREGSSAAAVRAHTGKKIGSDGNVAGFGDLVGKVLDPIGHAEDFVNDEDDGRFVLGFGIGDEGFDRAAVVLDGDPFTVARGFVELGHGPVLGEGKGSDKQQTSGKQYGALHRLLL